MNWTDSLSVVLAVVVVFSTVLAPVGVASAQSSATTDSGVLSPNIKDDLSAFGLGSLSVPDHVVTHGADANPTFIVEYSDESAFSDWVGSNGDELREMPGNRSVVALPPDKVVNPLSFDTQLSELAYIESISYNIEVSTTPVGTASDNGEKLPNGVAWTEEANVSTMADVRGRLNVDKVNATGKNTTVAVLDTGITLSDGQVFGNGSVGSETRVTAAKNFVTNETVNTSASNPDWSKVKDENGHGTFVASQIAANTSNATYDGIAPDANLVVGKVLGDGGGGSAASIIDGMEWACAKDTVDVVSMSLGSKYFSPAMKTQVERCVEEHNTTVVVAVGNSRATGVVWVASPADSQVNGQLSVGSVTNEPRNKTEASWFSNIGKDGGIRDGSNGASRGAAVEVVAPGMKIEAMTTVGGLHTTTKSGTSMATPNTAGVIALVIEQNPDLSDDPAKVEERLSSTTTTLPQAGWTAVGDGRVDAYQAVNNIEHDQTQKEVRSDSAVARDKAHLTATGNPVERLLYRVGGLDLADFDIPVVG